MSIISTDNFTMTELIYVPLGEHLPMMMRPYVVNATQQAVNGITDRLQETKSGTINPSTLTGFTDGIIQHSAVPYATSINASWVSTRRYTFLLKVKSFDAMGTEINSYIQGYTEYDGITPTGNIDGNLVHYINNVIETLEMTVNTPTGVLRSERLYKIYNVFAPQGDMEYFTQRPGDILENINTLNMSNVMDGSNNLEAYNSGSFINSFNNQIVGSSVDNGITSEYLSKLLNTGVLTNKSRDIHIGSYEISEQNTVTSVIPEPSVGENRFIRYLSAVGGFSAVRNQFNFNQLMTLDNTIYSRFKVLNITKDIINPLIAATPNVGDHWVGQDPVTVKAYSLIEASVAMALKYGFIKLYFTASNMTNPTGTVDVFITNFNSFINLDEQGFNYLLQIFKEKFVTDVFLSETSAGRVPTHMEAYIDLMGTSKINLSYANYPSNWYTIPTVANSAYSSAITTNQNALNETSFNVGQVIDAISSPTQQARNYY
jgi:hypothetical protein